jgi:hypothetical protein
MTREAARSGTDRMDLPRALAADLRDLAVDLSADGYTHTTLAMIEHNLRRPVPSILGASVTLHTPASPGAPVVVNFVGRTIDPHEISAALVLPLPGLTQPRAGSITFYAAQPDAFTQLRPQLAQALHLDPGQIDPQPPLPVKPVRPGADGLHDFAVVNRALGVLLNRGHTLDTARATLANQAKGSQTDITAAAHAFLGTARGTFAGTV